LATTIKYKSKKDSDVKNKIKTGFYINFIADIKDRNKLHYAKKDNSFLFKGPRKKQ
jgi:hypothetical protein